MRADVRWHINFYITIDVGKIYLALYVRLSFSCFYLTILGWRSIFDEFGWILRTICRNNRAKFLFILLFVIAFLYTHFRCEVWGSFLKYYHLFWTSFNNFFFNIWLDFLLNLVLIEWSNSFKRFFRSFYTKLRTVLWIKVFSISLNIFLWTYANYRRFHAILSIFSSNFILQWLFWIIVYIVLSHSFFHICYWCLRLAREFRSVFLSWL